MRHHSPIRRLACLLLCITCLLGLALPAMAETVESRRVTLSGDAADTFTAQENCFTETDRVLIFFQKGITVPGNVAAIVETAMDELEAVAGLSFQERWNNSHTNNYFALFEEEIFDPINPNGAKTEVLIANLGIYSPYATENSAIIDVIDLEGEERLALYHELAHVLYMRNGTDLGLCLDEGFATWTLDQLYRQKGIPCWTTDFYMTASDFDVGLITGGAASFSSNFENSDDNYCYGYRLVTFLTETYGKEILPKLLETATKDGFDSTFNSDDPQSITEDHEHMKRILMTVAGEDVFDRFAAWHEAEMPRVYADYQKYMGAAEAQ